MKSYLIGYEAFKINSTWRVFLGTDEKVEEYEVFTADELRDNLDELMRVCVRFSMG